MTRTSPGETLRAAARGSVLVRVIANLVESMRAQPAALPRHVVVDDLAALRGFLTSSVLVMGIGGRVVGALEAVRGSRAIRAAARWREVGPLEGWQIIRAAGLAGLAATATVGLSALVDPRPASIYRWWMWAVMAGVSAVAALGARAFDAARLDSRLTSPPE